jgi:glycosyltransferase involved in cell wall biosynthesis
MQTPEFDYVKHDENGVVIESPEAELFADAIEELLADSARMKRLAAGGIESARELAMEHMVDAYVAAVRVSHT